MVVLVVLVGGMMMRRRTCRDLGGRSGCGTGLTEETQRMRKRVGCGIVSI
jgi:hypothetical protein